jgi:hypothetical protein
MSLVNEPLVQVFVRPDPLSSNCVSATPIIWLQDPGIWVGRHVGARPKKAKQADHPRQAKDDVELARIAAELNVKVPYCLWK